MSVAKIQGGADAFTKDFFILTEENLSKRFGVLKEEKEELQVKMLLWVGEKIEEWLNKLEIKDSQVRYFIEAKGLEKLNSDFGFDYTKIPKQALPSDNVDLWLKVKIGGGTNKTFTKRLDEHELKFKKLSKILDQFTEFFYSLTT